MVNRMARIATRQSDPSSSAMETPDEATGLVLFGGRIALTFTPLYEPHESASASSWTPALRRPPAPRVDRCRRGERRRHRGGGAVAHLRRAGLDRDGGDLARA